MSKMERNEYKETKVMRTLSPTRYGGSAQNVTEFDNSLDHLLEDLQSTVSRPGSSMTNGYSRTMDNTRSGSQNLVTVTPVTDYSVNDSYSYTAPDGSKHFKTVKKESYSYKSSGHDMPPEKMRMQNNINQLDSLLDDLQQVKQIGVNNNNVAIESGYQQQYHKSKVVSGKRVVEQNVPYGERTRSLDRTDRERTVHRDAYQHNEGTYGDLKSIRTTSPSPSRSSTSTLNKQTKVTNVHAYPAEVVQTTTPDINPEILANLDPELLPHGNTKVTTTIKTYTYEIPGAGGTPIPLDTDKYVYSPNQSITTPSKSFVYSKQENNQRNYQTSQTTHGYVPASPPSDRKIIKETVTTKNYHPSNKQYKEPGTGQTTYVYNESTTTRNYNDYPGGQPRNPPRGQDTYYVRETHHNTLTNRSDSPDNSSLPPVNTTIHKFDSMSNLNARQYPEVETFDPKHPPYPNTPPGGRTSPYQYPNGSPDVITYKYRSTTNTSNNYRTGYPYDDEPLLPRKFPTDETEGPPKKLDDLMANIGNEPPTNAYNIGWKHHEQEMAQQRKVDSLKAQQDFDNQQKEERKEVPRSKNVTGPPVYYPPGHEMFSKKEEGGGAWRAEGAMAREKGSYKYEAESKSKSKSSGGAAIVPVCLPLCCGLPCTII